LKGIKNVLIKRRGLRHVIAFWCLFGDVMAVGVVVSFKFFLLLGRIDWLKYYVNLVFFELLPVGFRVFLMLFPDWKTWLLGCRCLFG
jgi:hypothetical protein